MSSLQYVYNANRKSLFFDEHEYLIEQPGPSRRLDRLQLNEPSYFYMKRSNKQDPYTELIKRPSQRHNLA
jgi:hypothetical protein